MPLDLFQNIARTDGKYCPVTGRIVDGKAPDDLSCEGRNAFEAAIRSAVPDAVIIDGEFTRSPQISCISFPGANGEVVRDELAKRHIAVGTASACAAGGEMLSGILRERDVPFGLAKGSVTFRCVRFPTGTALADVIDSRTRRTRRSDDRRTTARR